MFDLIEVITKDGLMLQGIISKSSTDTLVIYVHGLGGDFYGSPKKVYSLATAFEKLNISFMSLNNRGAHQMNGIKKTDPTNPKGYTYVNGGRCYETFEDSILDIEAYISKAKSLNYKKVILFGHSSGANKIAHYLSINPDPLVNLAILSGPVSDVPSQMAIAGLKYEPLIRLAKKLVSEGLSDALMPPNTPSEPITAQRFLSLSVCGSAEDVFQYYTQNQTNDSLKKIKTPTLMILGEKDEHLTMDAKTVIQFFSKTNPFLEGKIIPNALHSFIGLEDQLAKEICSWIKLKRIS